MLMICRWSGSRSWIGDSDSIHRRTIILIDMGPFPIHNINFFLRIKRFFIGLGVEVDAIEIFPLLMPLSILSPVRINSVKLEQEQPTNRLNKGPDKVPMNMSMCSLSVKGGWTLLARSLHFCIYSLNPSFFPMVISCN